MITFYHKLFHSHGGTKALDVLSLNFQKAFDSVRHGKLMLKVKALGITADTGDWIEN